MNKEIKEFFVSEIERLDKADLICCVCDYAAVICLDESMEAQWPIYKNPNWETIVASYRDFIQFITVRPEAVKFIHNTSKKIICPKCSHMAMVVANKSQYSLHGLYLSLICEK